MSSATETAATTLTIRRTFKAPRERVFAAFTDADMMMRWMGPPGTTVTAIAFDAREGGAYRIAYQSERMGDMVAKGTIVTLRAPEYLAYSWRWEEDDVNDEHDTSVRIEFIDRGNETEIVFVQDGFASEESRDTHTMGWSGAFTKIDGVL
jgi:uncharacterized protein YndB with AHSA1/START domain